MGRSRILCIPSIALWGGFKIGVESIEPKTPPFVIEKVPPSISSILSLFSRARLASLPISISICARVRDSAFRTTGTIKPLGALTAIPIST